MTTKKWLSLIVVAACVPLAAVAQRAEARRDIASADTPAQPTLPSSNAGRIPLHTTLDHGFHVGAGDVLHISVWEEPQLTTKVVVRPDGYISMPLVDEVMVSGLTPEQIQKALTEQLTQVVKHPRVYVVVEEIHSRVVYITGEVEHPGAYPLMENISVLQLIARSGGLTEYAHRKGIFVMRQDSGQKLKVDYDSILKGKNVEENVALLPGDMVVIP